VTLSPMNNAYLPSTGNNTSGASMMNTNPMMTYPHAATTTAPPNHMQHHPANNISYRPHQAQPMYNNFMAPHPNAMPTGYYPMPGQGRMPSINHHAAQIPKRAPFMQQPQPSPHQRPTTPMNQQQLQLHMSMNVTLPHVIHPH
jgi:hypothetical protein